MLSFHACTFGFRGAREEACLVNGDKCISERHGHEWRIVAAQYATLSALWSLEKGLVGHIL